MSSEERGAGLARALVIAAPASGSGKTTVTAGLLRALGRRGVAVRAAKSGPDYIDPGFHAAAGGARGPNLDSWAMRPELLDSLLREAARGADLLLIEGAMGLFDGVTGNPAGRSGAASDLAALYGVPVLAVLDVSAQAQTAAAVLRGLAVHDPAVRVGAVVLNRVAGERHRDMIADAIAPLGIPLIGALPRDESLALPSRHLGLVQAAEHGDLDARLDRLADAVERHLDLGALLAAAGPLGPGPATAASAPSPPPSALRPPGRRIALAADAAFSFIYPHLLSEWRRAGAQIATFSPLADEPPPESCDCCWLPGGYPELHAGTLAAAQRFTQGLRRFAATRPVHGECGGYMVLGTALEDPSGVRHPMTGLLGHSTSFAVRRLHLGYREAWLAADCPLGPRGARIRGHEFHHSTLLDPGTDPPLADLFDGQLRPLGPSGGRRGHVTGSYFHAIALETP
jgi:cobyrinic acid a,c-diamide synthase